MATPPDKIPTWADDESALVTEPSAGRRAAGWTPSERPSAQHFNWLFNRIGAWIAHIFGRITGTAPDSGPGLSGTGADGQAGVVGAAGPGSSAPGVKGSGFYGVQGNSTVAGGSAVLGQAFVEGSGGTFLALGNYPGVSGGSTQGVGGEFNANSNRGNIRLWPVFDPPSDPATGEVYCESGGPGGRAALYFYDGIEWREVVLAPAG